MKLWRRRAALGLLVSAFASAYGASSGAALQEGQPVYRVYVANESSDIVSRVAFTPGRGAAVEKEIPVGVMPADIDGAHGISVAPDGKHWYVTIAHGTPRGYLWKFAAGADTLAGRARLGLFPATMGITPDSRFMLTANFNLHGDMTPSTLSVVYLPDMVEISTITTCLMPHGSRISADGLRHYSVCMHSDELVEVEMDALETSARFSLAPGMERLKEEGSEGGAHSMDDPGARCSPTWAEPGAGSRARFVYVACNRNREILEVDTESWSVSRRFASGAGPYNLEVVGNGQLLIATLKGEQGIGVYDLESGKLLRRLDSSRAVTHGVVASPDGRYAFVTNESVGSVRGTLDVVDLEALEIVSTVELGHQSGGIDFWSRSDEKSPPG